MVSMGRVQTAIEDAIPERTSFRLQLSLVDEAGDALSSLTTLTLKIYTASGVLIRDVGSVLSSFSSGAFDWTSDPDDAAIIASTIQRETHLALLEWTWDSGDRAGKHVIVHTVANLVGVPAA